MNNLDEIISYINDLPEIKRLHELDSFIDKNERIKNKINDINDIKKKMVNSKEFNQINQYKEYKEEYEKLLSELNDMPFIEEYLELVDYANNLLFEIKDRIEAKIKF